MPHAALPPTSKSVVGCGEVAELTAADEQPAPAAQADKVESVRPRWDATLVEQEYDAVHSEQLDDAPLGEQLYDAPLVEQGYHPPPVAQEYDAPPVAQEYDAPPVAQEYDAPPVAQEYDAPSVEQQYGSTDLEQRYETAAVEEQYATPSLDQHEFGVYSAPYAGEQVEMSPCEPEFAAEGQEPDLPIPYRAPGSALPNEPALPVHHAGAELPASPSEPDADAPLFPKLTEFTELLGSSASGAVEPASASTGEIVTPESWDPVPDSPRLPQIVSDQGAFATDAVAVAEIIQRVADRVRRGELSLPVATAEGEASALALVLAAILQPGRKQR